MAKIISAGIGYSLQGFESEAEFEAAVIENQKALFGPASIYIDVKKRMGANNSYHKGIPDGYLIDFFDPSEPQLYFIENELASHDVYGHITEQVARFFAAISTSPAQIREKLLKYIKDNNNLLQSLEDKIKESPFGNIDALFNFLTEKSCPKIVVVIDDITADLNSGLKIFANPPEVVLLQRYSSGSNSVFYYEPMRSEVDDLSRPNNQNCDIHFADFDTIVCPAFEDGFQHAYINNNAWWEVRLSQEAREHLKYVAIYQKSPIAEVRHVAEIDRIEPYKNSGKFILYLKNNFEVTPIKLEKGVKGVAPQGPRYTTIEKIKKAKKLSDLWV